MLSNTEFANPLQTLYELHLKVHISKTLLSYVENTSLIKRVASRMKAALELAYIVEYKRNNNTHT